MPADREVRPFLPDWTGVSSSFWLDAQALYDEDIARGATDETESTTVSNQGIAAAAEQYHAALEEADDCEWRPGHSDPQNVYARMGARIDQKDDPKVGEMRSPQHAARIITLHNDDLKRRKAEEEAR